MNPWSWVDTAFGLGGLLALAAGTTADDRTAWVNSDVSADVRNRRRHGHGSPSTPGDGCHHCIERHLPRDGDEQPSSRREPAATGGANALSYYGWFAAADLFIGRLRRSAIELETARTAAVENGARLATEQERNRQHRLLHDSALQTLEVVAKGWATGDDVAVRMQARSKRPDCASRSEAASTRASTDSEPCCGRSQTSSRPTA